MKSYKDLPREVVLNAPEGAMFCRTRTAMSRNKISTRRLLWANAKTHDFYKFEDGHLSYFYDQRTWVKFTIGSLSSWLKNNPDIIPLPNVKIPWEATQDSVSPVPECFNIRVWVDGAKDHQFSLRDARHWRWNIRSGYGNITACEIVDPDYMREESSELVGSSESVQLVGQSIISDSELLRKLKLLNHIGEQFPIISDCAKAAMVRLVEKWVGK